MRIYISLTADEEVQLVDSHALPRPGPTPEQEGSILPAEWSRDVQLLRVILGQADFPVSRFGLYSPNHLS